MEFHKRSPVSLKVDSFRDRVEVDKDTDGAEWINGQQILFIW